MKPTFTIQKASIAAGNKYLVWHDGQIWKITSLDVEFKQLTIRIHGRYKVINLSDIGKTAQIIVKPLELLTVEVDGVVPIVELFKLIDKVDYVENKVSQTLSFKDINLTIDDNWNHCLIFKNNLEFAYSKYGSFCLYHLDWLQISNQQQLFEKLHSMHFDYGILQDGFGISTEEIKKFK